MPTRKSSWLDILRLWIWSPFVVMPVALLVYVAWPVPTPQPPIFDVQLHYNDDTWRYFSTDEVRKGLKRHNIIGALVTSYPNENTDRLSSADRHFFHPMVAPTRTRDDRYGWFANPELLAMAENGLRSGAYRGIGDFNLPIEQIDSPPIKRLLALVAERGLLLGSRTNEKTIRALLESEPRLRVVWAHAGLSTPPGRIEEMLHRYPTLWVDLSQRQIAPNGELDPAWREVILRYPGRFMVGSGLYTKEAWYYLHFFVADIRKWLAQLPTEVAERVAWRNAQQLLQVGNDAPRLSAGTSSTRARAGSGA